MHKLKTSACFDSAHFLKGYEGKCANIHGHRWKIEAVINGSELQTQGTERGMLVDFADFKKSVRDIADQYDHTLIYEKGSLSEDALKVLRAEGFSMTEVSFRPTAENLAKCFCDILADKGLPVSSVTVYETPDNCAIYEVD